MNATPDFAVSHPYSNQSNAWRGNAWRGRARHVAVGFMVSLCALLLYLSGVSSTVTYGGDCGELIAASYRLGIAHPTGYALYCLLGRCFASLLPLGEVGWRYNVLSALLGALSVGLLTATAYRLADDNLSDDNLCNRAEEPHQDTPQGASSTRSTDTRSRALPSALQGKALWPAVGAGLLLAGFYDFWSQCVLAEVYALNALMLAALLYGAVAWHQSGDWRWFLSLAVLFGLALNAHLSCIYLAPGLLLYTVVQHRARFGAGLLMVRRLLVAVTFMMTAYALTLYLPLRSGLFPEPPPVGTTSTRSMEVGATSTRSAANVDQTTPRHETPREAEWWPLDWTHPADFGRWYAHASAKQYKNLLFAHYAVPVGERTVHVTWFAQTLPEFVARLGTLGGRIAVFYLWCTPLLLVGLWQSWRSPWRHDEYSKAHATRTGGRWLGALLLLTFMLNVGVQANYRVSDQSNFFFPAYLVMAIWMGFGFACLGRALPPRWRVSGLASLVLASVVVQWALAAPFASHRGATQARDTALDRAQAAETLMAQTGRIPAVVLFGDDALWSFWYAQYVLGRAQNMHTPWSRRRAMIESGRMAEYVAQLQRKGPVALSGWDTRTDLRFPYVLLNQSGTLCLASTRKLPAAATPLPPTGVVEDATSNIIAARSNIIGARFRPAHEVSSQRGIVALKRENMAAFEVDFRLPWASPLDTKSAGTATVDKTISAPLAHVGYIQVLMSPADTQSPGHLISPSPAQDNVRKTGSGPSLVAWKQTRRLIVPLGARLSTRWQAVVPLQMETEAPPARYDVWLRLVRSSQDRSTPWQRVTSMQMIG
ncbi:MAG TPA: DUF2723 domain-containing protein [Abditibacteriaceae bacterium]|jgi:hypothetical protein